MTNLPPSSFNLPPGVSLRDIDPDEPKPDWPTCPRCGKPLEESGNTLCDECSEIRTRTIAVAWQQRNPRWILQ